MHDDLKRTHAPIFALQTEMKDDAKFRALCVENGLPWDFNAGYEPRGYNGPPPEQTRLLVLLAEPGAITPTEARNLLPAISHRRWVEPYDLRLQEHYWRANLRELCRYIWPEDTEDSMYTNLGKSCTFWMSLPRGAQTRQVPREPLRYFLQTYLKRFLALFPSTIILAAGEKAQTRLRSVHAEFEPCSAFTRPESNKPSARESWRRAGQAIASRLALNTTAVGRAARGESVVTVAREPERSTSKGETPVAKLMPHLRIRPSNRGADVRDAHRFMEKKMREHRADRGRWPLVTELIEIAVSSSKSGEWQAARDSSEFRLRPEKYFARYIMSALRPARDIFEYDTD